MAEKRNRNRNGRGAIYHGGKGDCTPSTEEETETEEKEKIMTFQILGSILLYR